MISLFSNANQFSKILKGNIVISIFNTASFFARTCTEMATLESLPNELLGPIIKNLCDEDRKIHHFDPVGVKDLQHVRLVSRRMSTLATPHLFENMILDEKLLTEEHVTRISKFAENNPSLALHVRRLQRRLSPLIIDPEYHCNYYIDYILNDAFDLESVYDRSHWRRFMQILVARCEIDQQREEVSSSGPALGCCSVSTPISQFFLHPKPARLNYTFGAAEH